MDLVDLPSQMKAFHDGRFNQLQFLIDNYNEDRSFREDFAQLVLMLFYAKYNKLTILATDLIEEAIRKLDLSEYQRQLLDILKAEFLILRGNYSLSSKILASYDFDNSPQEILPMVGSLKYYGLMVKAHYYFSINEIESALTHAKNAYSLPSTHMDPLVVFELHEILSDIYMESGNYDHAMKVIDDFEQSNRKSSKFLDIRICIQKATILNNKGELEGARTLIFDFEKQYGDELPVPIIWELNNLKAKSSLYLGDLSEAEAYDLKNLEIAKKINSSLFLAVSYNNLGTLYKSLGDMDLGLEYLFLSLQKNQELGNTNQIGISYNNIAINYLMKGELDTALDYLTKSLEIAEEYGRDSSRAVCYVNLGQVHHMKGNYSSAKKYYLLCKEIDEKYKNGFNLAEVLYNLVTLHVEKEEITEAGNYLTELERINENFENKVINLRCRLANVQILKSSKRSIHKAKAQEKLIEIVEEDPVDFELYVVALLNLCDLLLLELKQTGEEEVLEEIKLYVDRLHQYATKQQVYNILAETYLIKSKIAQLELDMDEARRFIELAEKVSLDKGLDRLALKISSYYDSLLDKMKTMELIYDKNSSIKDRLEEVQLEDLLLNMITTRADDMSIEPETPTMFLINQAGGGGNLYKKIFQENTGVNEDLIAGLFSALHTLSDEIFNTESSTQRIKHDEFTIIMKPVQNEFLFCYVFRGQSFNALKKLDRLVQSIENSKTIWDALNREISYLTNREKEGMDLIVDQIINSERS